MNRALLVLAVVVPSLAFACGGGSGMGNDPIGGLLLLLIFGAPLWMPLALLGGGVFLAVALSRARPAQLHARR